MISNAKFAVLLIWQRNFEHARVRILRAKMGKANTNTKQICFGQIAKPKDDPPKQPTKRTHPKE